MQADINTTYRRDHTVRVVGKSVMHGCGAMGTVLYRIYPEERTVVPLRAGYIRVAVKVTDPRRHYRDGDFAIWDITGHSD